MLRQRSWAVPPSNTSLTSSSAIGTDMDSRLAEAIRQVPFKDGSFDSVLNEVVKLARILTNASGAAIAFRSGEGTVCRATSGGGGPPIGASVDVTSGISRQCLDSGTPVRCDDIASDARVDANASGAIGMRAMAVVPIYTARGIAGIVAVFSSTPAAFTDEHLQKLEQLAKLIDCTTGSDEALSPASPQVLIKRGPNLRLLVEPEPALRTFFRNIVDLVWLRSRSASGGSLDEHGWDHVFVESQIPWKPFVESVVLHVVMVGMLLGLSRVWPRERLIFSQPLRDAKITYYPFSQSYPARNSRPITRPNLRHALARRMMPGAQRATEAATPIRVKSGGQKTAAVTAPAPQMPTAGGSGWRSLGLGSGNSVLPAPPVSGLRGRLADLPAGTVVAPSPDIGSTSGLRQLNAPGVRVVPPSPKVAASLGGTHAIHAGGLGPGSGGLSASSIVPPPPAVNEHPALTYGAAGLTGNPAVQVIAPPPSVNGQGGFGSGGRSLALGRGGSDVVPPPPSVEGGAGGAISGGGRGNSLAGSGSQVVPPSPSIKGLGGPGTRGAGTLTGSRGGGSEVVPPPQSLQGGGRGLSAGGRGGSLTGAGSEVVPPAPSLGSGGNSLSGGRGSSLASAGAGTVLPPASGGSGAAPGPGAAPMAPNVPPASLPRVGTTQAQTFQEEPLRVVSLAMSLPASSYFSNYEVFVAERWLSKTESQLIKLVYVFLPYQRRLSEYGDLTKVFKVRITRDPTCDESLMAITWPEGEHPRPGSSAQASDRSKGKDLLPCYRTTADDYRRAVSENRAKARK